MKGWVSPPEARGPHGAIFFFFVGSSLVMGKPASYLRDGDPGGIAAAPPRMQTGYLLHFLPGQRPRGAPHLLPPPCAPGFPDRQTAAKF